MNFDQLKLNLQGEVTLIFLHHGILATNITPSLSHGLRGHDDKLNTN